MAFIDYQKFLTANKTDKIVRMKGDEKVDAGHSKARLQYDIASGEEKSSLHSLPFLDKQTLLASKPLARPLQ